MYTAPPPPLYKRTWQHLYLDMSYLSARRRSYQLTHMKQPQQTAAEHIGSAIGDSKISCSIGERANGG